MAIFEHPEDYDIGIVEIDRQHHMIIERLNFLNEAILAGEGGTIIRQMVMDLMEYARDHFRTEEAYLRKYRYPKLEEHKAEHSTFAKDAAELAALVSEGKSIDPQAVLRYLETWVKTHLAVHDMEYRDYLRSKGVIGISGTGSVT
jgi:hemerythrin